MSKKYSIFSILLFVVLVFITTICYGASGVITGTTVKLREEPNLEGKLIMLLSVDFKVEVIEKSGEWYKVKYEDKIGYVHGDYIKVEEDIVANNKSSEQEKPEEQASIQEQQNEQTQQEQNNQEVSQQEIALPASKVAKQNQKIRIIPVINSSIIGDLKEADNVTVLEIINGWAFIHNDTAEGWVRYDRLSDSIEQAPIQQEPEETKTEPEETNEKEPEPKTQNTKIKYISASVVNVRSKPDTSSEVVTRLSLNTEVTVVSEENNWSKVTINGKEGYIASNLLSETKQETTSRSAQERTPVQENVTQTQEVTQDVQTNSELGAQIVSYAKQYIGVKYVSGGSTPNGFDCSGFTYYVYKQFGYTIPRSSTTQAGAGVAVAKENLQLGDLVIFRDGNNQNIGHVGIYIGNNQFIHSSSPGDYVKITSLSMSYYQTRYVGARRII